MLDETNCADTVHSVCCPGSISLCCRAAALLLVLTCVNEEAQAKLSFTQTRLACLPASRCHRQKPSSRPSCARSIAATPGGGLCVTVLRLHIYKPFEQCLGIHACGHYDGVSYLRDSRVASRSRPCACGGRHRPWPPVAGHTLLLSPPAHVYSCVCTFTYSYPKTYVNIDIVTYTFLNMAVVSSI